MEKVDEEKRYKIEKIDSGVKNAVFYQAAKTAMYIGLFAAAGTVSNVLTKDYNMNLMSKYSPMYEQVIGCILYATSLISVAGITKGLLGLMDLCFFGAGVKKLKKEHKEPVSFKELGFDSDPVTEYRESIQSVILNGFSDEDEETISEGAEKKR